ncbi:MAG: hypothetical protein ABSB82_12825 [Terriglobia bacterium]|jgi:hypothetical protein
MNLTPYVSTWVVLAFVVLALGIYRIRLGRRDDSTLDVLASDPGVLAHQKDAVHRIKVIDVWGQTLTVLAFLYGLAIVGYYLYSVWEEGAKIQMH